MLLEEAVAEAGKASPALVQRSGHRLGADSAVGYYEAREVELTLGFRIEGHSGGEVEACLRLALGVAPRRLPVVG